MANKMLIDATHPEETRVVVLRGNRVEEFDFETAHRKQLRGNIYLVKVTRVEPSLQAAFVDYGGNRHGFLAFSEIHPDYYQIPVADRQALIDEDSRAQRDFDDEAERGGGRNRNRGRGRRSNSSRRDETVRSETVAENAAPAGFEPYSQTETGADSATAAVGGDFQPDHGGDTADTTVALHDQFHDAPVQYAQQAGVHGPDDGGHGGDHNPDHRDDDHADGSETYAATAADQDHANQEPAHDDRGPGGEHAGESGDQDSDGDETHQYGDLEGRSHDSNGGDNNSSESQSRDGNGGDNGHAADEEEGIESIGGADALEEVPEYAPRHRRQYKIQEVIKRRQIILVQVVKEERGTKGAALTTYLSLAGRYSVLMPNTARGGGISRKITSSDDRRRLKEIAEDLQVPDGMGVILRTAGANRTKTEVKRDLEYLMRLWETVRDTTLKSTAPTLVYEEGSLVKRSIRDLYGKDIDEVTVAGDDSYKEAKDFMRMLMPSHAKNVKPYRDQQPLFARNGIETQLDAMFSPTVQLRSGGYIVINQTEALVAIDVNSGRSTREHHIEDTALKTNCEAADEVARQLRLRDLAGLIVIDFIDMDEKRNNRTVERRLKDALHDDRARIQVGRISHFGLMEMSRQRIRTSVLESSTEKCPECGGTGHVRSVSSVALQLLRTLEEHLVKGATHNLIVRARPDVALYVLNQKRGHLRALEERFRIAIAIQSDPNASGQVPVTIERGEQVMTLEQAKALIAAQPDSLPVIDDADDLDVAEEEDFAAGEGREETAEMADARDESMAAGPEGAGQHAKSGDADGSQRRRGRRRGRRGGAGRNDDGRGAEPRHGDRQPSTDFNDTPMPAYASGGEDDNAGDSEHQSAGAMAADSDSSGSERASEGERGESDGTRRRRRGRRGGRRNRRGRDGEAGAGNGERSLASPFESQQESPEESPANSSGATTHRHEASEDLPSEDLPSEDLPSEDLPSEDLPHSERPVEPTAQDVLEAAYAPPGGAPPLAQAEMLATAAAAEPAREAPRRRSTVREPAPASGDSAFTPPPSATPVMPAAPAPSAPDSDSAEKPRKSGWWSKRLLGG